MFDLFLFRQMSLPHHDMFVRQINTPPPSSPKCGGFFYEPCGRGGYVAATLKRIGHSQAAPMRAINDDRRREVFHHGELTCAHVTAVDL